MKITKAVIPCGGMGTRFFPITKAVPKELLPIIDTPSVALIVEEAAKSGITDVMLILGNEKEAIKQYFTRDSSLLRQLDSSGKGELAAKLRQTDFGVNITYAYQHQARGSADAVYCAKDFTGDSAFCLAWGDDIITGDIPVMGQLAAAYQEANSYIVGVQHFAGDDIVKYGVACLDNNHNACKNQNFALKASDNIQNIQNCCGNTQTNFQNVNNGKAAQCNNNQSRLIRCKGFLEKPPLSQIPSRYAALGRYVLTSGIYKEIEGLQPVGGEYRLTDSINDLCQKDRVFIYDFIGKRYDCGDKLGFIKATIEYALNREFSIDLKEYLKDLVKTF